MGMKLSMAHKKHPKPKSARQVAVSVLRKIEEDKAYSNLILDQAFSDANLSHDDKSLCTKIVYGTLDQIYLLDQYIKKYSKKPLKSLDLTVLIILRVSLWQLYFSRIPEHAVVNEAVEMTAFFAYPFAKGFVNGTLRSIIRENDALIPQSNEARTGFSSELYKHFKRILKSEREVLALADAYWEHRGISIRIRDEKLNTVEQVRLHFSNEMPAERSFEVEEGSFLDKHFYVKNIGQSIQTFQLWQDGAFVVQGESAALAAMLLNPQADTNVLDLCAAPGGKTVALYDIAPKAHITASDVHPHRVKLIENNLKRLSISNIDVKQYDATLAWPHDEQFDKILLDAPCSALGLLGSKAEIRYTWSDNKSISTLLDLQKSILNQTSKIVRENGEILYSTCTLNPEENEIQIHNFLKTHPQFKLISIKERIQMHAPRLFDLDSTLEEQSSKGYITLWPHRVKSEGFFIALLKRISI